MVISPWCYTRSKAPAISRATTQLLLLSSSAWFQEVERFSSKSAAESPFTQQLVFLQEVCHLSVDYSFQDLGDSGEERYRPIVGHLRPPLPLVDWDNISLFPSFKPLVLSYAVLEQLCERGSQLTGTFLQQSRADVVWSKSFTCIE